MPENAKKRSVKTAPVKEAPPAYLTETLPDNSYLIMMMDNIEGTDCEQVEISRAEYLAIKRMLIKMRGYAAPPAEPEAATTTKPKAQRPRKTKRKAA